MTVNTTPEIDIIIPVHSATRPINRAVHSVLDGTLANVLVTVVAHNISAEIITSNLGDLAGDNRVQVLHLADGINSPAGPMNYGISRTGAPYFGVMGSDDSFEKGALDSWLQLLKQHQSTTVIPRMLVAGKPDPLPPARANRSHNLDPVKDRLLYRCSPVGLISRKAFPNLRFTEGLKSGEDLAFTAELWLKGENIYYARTAPGYQVNDDAADRVTMATATRSVQEDFAFLEDTVQKPWFAGLKRSQKKAFAVKTLRMHVFDAIAARLEQIENNSQVAAELNNVVAKIEQIAPGSINLLARADRETLKELAAKNPSKERITQSLSARWGGGLAALLPQNPFLAFHSQAPYRTLRNMQA